MGCAAGDLGEGGEEGWIEDKFVCEDPKKEYECGQGNQWKGHGRRSADTRDGVFLK